MRIFDLERLSSELGGVIEDVEEDGQEQGTLLGSTDTAVPKEKPAKDIGSVPMTSVQPLGHLQSTQEQALAKVYHVIGHRELEFAPPWFIRAAYDVEEKTWDGVYQVVKDTEVPRDANAISSHVAYKVKVNEDGTLKLKAWICPHGNRDKDKDGTRKDSDASQLPVIRLMLSLSALMGFRVGIVDISAAYLQSGPIKREIFVYPLRRKNILENAV